MPKLTNEKSMKNKSRKNIKNKTDKSNERTKDEKFSFDEEIVIGLRRIDDKPTEDFKHQNDKNNKKSKTSDKKIKERNRERNKQKNKEKNRNIGKKKNGKAEEPELIIKSKYMQNYDNDEDYDDFDIRKNNPKNKKSSKTDKSKPKKLTKKQQISKKRRKLIFKIIKWLTLVGIVIAGIAYAMLSPIFNIKNISVTGNFKISSETIISLSELSIDQNIFNFRTSNIIDNIKQNAYIDKVEINRKLPDEIQIVVYEREATYMITLGNAYVYINNQGYILEITATKGDFPLIVGYDTPEEQIQEGNRLITEDLERLSDILKIMESASSVEGEIANLITQIDISDKSNYILTLEKEGKKIYLGDTTNLSTKMLWINEFLETEEKKQGIIYLNVDLNTDRPYFRERIES